MAASEDFNASLLPTHLEKYNTLDTKSRSSNTEVFLGKGILKICSKFTGEHACRSVISIKLHLLVIFRTYFLKNIYGWLLLQVKWFCNTGIF